MTAALDLLLASYLDLTRHLDPLRHPWEAPPEVSRRLGQFDVAWLVAQEAALRSIAHAIEDLEEVESLADEVDRTMLIETVRAEGTRLAALTGDTSDPGLPLRHAVAALDGLLGEDFDASREAALRSRLSELPELLRILSTEKRPAPLFLVDAAHGAAAALGERLDAAAERLDEETVAMSRVALAKLSPWLAESARVGGVVGVGEEIVTDRLSRMSNDPVGISGTLRVLELRRVGVARSLDGAARDLGLGDNWVQELETLREEAVVDVLDRDDVWQAEWDRIAGALDAVGLAPGSEPPPPVPDVADQWALAAWAVRVHAMRLFHRARAVQPRSVRRLLVAPGLVRGWGRTVAAMLRETPVLGEAERRLASAELAMNDAVAAETDLLLQSRRSTPAELVERTVELLGTDQATAMELVVRVAAEPFEALAAALAHEGWQGWHADVGGDPGAFLRTALEGGGLAVPLARWSQGA